MIYRGSFCCVPLQMLPLNQFLSADLKKLKQKNSYRLMQGMNEEGKSLQASYTFIQK